MDLILDITIKYWFPVLFGVLSGAVAYMWRQLKAFKQGLLILLQNSLLETYYLWVDKEYVPVGVMERFTKIYNAYHVLGGNGVGTKVFEELNKLPSSEPEKLKEKMGACVACPKNVYDRGKISL